MVRVQSFVSISLAKEFGFTVHGIDIFPPFVREAGAEVARAGLEFLCTFQSGDVRDAIQTARGYDIVVFAGAGGVLGDLAATICSLRQVVRSGGYIVIEDGYLRDLSRSVSTEWAYYREHDETVQQLTSCGDVMIREVEISDEEVQSFNRETTGAIRRRANGLARQHPEVAGLLAEYVQWEEEISESLEKETIWTVWLLQRA